MPVYSYATLMLCCVVGLSSRRPWHRGWFGAGEAHWSCFGLESSDA